MIQFDNVNHLFGERRVLIDLTLTLSEQRIGIVGGNGSGKSTLARLCNGLILPTSGNVDVNGHDTARELAQVRSSVGFVFQDPDLQIIMPTVGEDLAFSLRPRRLPKHEIEAQVTIWLEKYGLTSHKDQGAHLLSGGEKQLLAIAAILITEPEIIVFDEPTTLLDLRNKHHIMDQIWNLDQQVIVITHDLDLLADFDRVIVLDQGRVAADDKPASALAAYRRLVLG